MFWMFQYLACIPAAHISCPQICVEALSGGAQASKWSAVISFSSQLTSYVKEKESSMSFCHYRHSLTLATRGQCYHVWILSTQENKHSEEDWIFIDEQVASQTQSLDTVEEVPNPRHTLLCPAGALQRISLTCFDTDIPWLDFSHVHNLVDITVVSLYH